MNKARLKRLDTVADGLETLLRELSEIRDEELEAYDNLPDGIQASERGEQMSENADALEEVCDNFESLISELFEILDSYEHQ